VLASVDLSSCGITRAQIEVAGYGHDASTWAESAVSASGHDFSHLIEIDKVVAAVSGPVGG